MADSKPLSNLAAWNLRMREVSSPQAFIDVGFYYMIAAALQRRVWSNADHQKLYPNIYPILVGDPGVGKGLVIKPVLAMLQKHKLEDRLAKTIDLSNTEAVAAAAVEAADYASDSQSKVKTPRPRLRIPIGANCTTYESLVNTCAESVRRINYKRYDAKLQKYVPDIYSHSSLAFALEEMSSLFHKDSSKVVQFLITAYDCGDYHYKTKTAGEDYVKSCCLNFLGGTTPAFIERSFRDDILNDGFASRAWFIYAPRNRFYRLESPPLTDEQKRAQEQLEAHILKLTKLYGYIPLAPDALAWFKNWWEVEQASPTYQRPNTDPKLDSYYSRKNIHVWKLAMLMHFAENAEVGEDGTSPRDEITLETVKAAKAKLEEWEMSMHLALNFGGANPLHRVATKIARFLKNKTGMTTDELMCQFWADIEAPDKQGAMSDILNYLRQSGKIALEEKTMRWYLKG